MKHTLCLYLPCAFVLHMLHFISIREVVYLFLNVGMI